MSGGCWGWRGRVGVLVEPRSTCLLKENPYVQPMITSRLTSKAQTTIPQAVRTALGLRPGDELAYVIEGGRAVLTRFDGRPVADDPFATFTEWNSAADAKAYEGL